MSKISFFIWMVSIIFFTTCYILLRNKEKRYVQIMTACLGQYDVNRDKLGPGPVSVLTISVVLATIAMDIKLYRLLKRSVFSEESTN